MGVKRVVSTVILALILITMLVSTFNIEPARAGYVLGRTIYIRADGGVDPPDAPILRIGSTYMLTGYVLVESERAIVIERDNIVLDGAGYTVQGKSVKYSTGIYIPGRRNITIQNINIVKFERGIHIDNSSNITVSRSNITNNWISYYVIPLPPIIAHRGEGVRLDYSSHVTISGNNIVENYRGIVLYESSNISVFGNKIAYSNSGVRLEGSSHTSVFGNNIIYNVEGVFFSYSSNNTIFGNNIAYNSEGILLFYSSHNRFWHNNIIKNRVVLHEAGPNVWDDGYPSGGNYWSDYTGVDNKKGPYQSETGSDDIGDTPYVINENNIDRYPLMKPWRLTPPILGFSITVSPASLTIRQGGSAELTITIVSVNGFSQPVKLSVSQAPPGVTVSLDPEQVKPLPYGSEYSTLTLSVSATTMVGNYTLTVTGTSNTIIHSSVNISLHIVPAPTPQVPTSTLVSLILAGIIVAIIIVAVIRKK